MSFETRPHSDQKCEQISNVDFFRQEEAPKFFFLYFGVNNILLFTLRISLHCKNGANNFTIALMIDKRKHKALGKMNVQAKNSFINDHT